RSDPWGREDFTYDPYGFVDSESRQYTSMWPDTVTHTQVNDRHGRVVEQALHSGTLIQNTYAGELYRFGLQTCA
ncbi:MAG: hypothetical protein AAFY03_08755, partial [Pseudomonadota bacterium]